MGIEYRRQRGSQSVTPNTGEGFFGEGFRAVRDPSRYTAMDPSSVEKYFAMGRYTRKGVSLSVLPSMIVPNFHNGKALQWSSASGRKDFYEGLPYPHMEKPENIPTTLFSEIPAEIDTLYSTENARHLAPTVLGLAMNDTPGSIHISDSLSKHSLRLARKAEKTGGKIVPTSLSKPSNQEFFREEIQLPHQDGDLLPPEELSAAKNTIRNILRPPKEHPVLHPQQFEQLQLDLRD